jgi:hypothetical protein
VHDWKKKPDDGRCATSYTLLRFSHMALSKNGGFTRKLLLLYFWVRRENDDSPVELYFPKILGLRYAKSVTPLE